jgi:spore coat polysaccharide biosynthesis predicted glycosyltransferase SpsG
VAGPRVERIFVNQGGSDPYGLTLKIIRALELGNFEQDFHVVWGGLVQKEQRFLWESLRNSVRGNYKIYTDLTKIELYHLMEKSDLAISAAGNTLYELAYLGVPTLVISHDQLHDKVAAAFEQKKAAINVGIGTDLTESQIASALERLINDTEARLTLSKNARSLFNNKKGISIVDELVTLYSR